MNMKITIDQSGRIHLRASTGEMTVIPSDYSKAEAQCELIAFCDYLGKDPEPYFGRLGEFF